MKIYLPKVLLFKSSKDLIRVGNHNDGGYLLSRSDLKESEVLISLGICDDWSFEEEFKKRKFVPIFSFDASIGSKEFGKQIIKSIIHLNSPHIIFKRFKTFFSYLKFFRGTNKHIKKFVSRQLITPSSKKELFISMTEIFEFVKGNKIFLKIDIEGSEYRILESILENQERIIGLAIEFHDCDLHINIIEDFIKKFKLKLVHIHANNYSLVDKNSQIPHTLEMTFSRNSELLKSFELPHHLDMPCNPIDEEIILDFIN